MYVFGREGAVPNVVFNYGTAVPPDVLSSAVLSVLGFSSFFWQCNKAHRDGIDGWTD